MDEIAKLPPSAQNEALRSAVGYDPDASLPSEREPTDEEVERLRDLVGTLWLYLSHYAERQLTTAQKELFYDVVEATRDKDANDPPLERWWREPDR